MEKLTEKDLPESIYEGGNRSLPKITITIGVFLLLGFFLNFPLMTMLEGTIQEQMNKASSSQCPVKFGKLRFEFLMPKFVIPSVDIPGRCFGRPEGQLALKNLSLNFLGPSFAPLGLKLKAEFKIEKDKVEIYSIISLKETIIKIKDNTINLSSLAPLNPNLSKVSGKFKINIKTTIKGKQASNSKFLIESKDLKILPIGIPQVMMTTPLLDLKNVKIKGELNQSGSKNILSLSPLNIGYEKSPLSADLKGDIRLSSASLQASALDLNIRLRIGNEIKEKYGVLLTGFLSSQLNEQDGYYEGKILGNLGSPRLKK